MLSRTEELTALFETLGILSCALMACLSRGWRTAIDQARAQISSVEDVEYEWLYQQRQLWATRHHKCVKNFRSDFLTSVLPRFYTGLRKLRIADLHRATASQSRFPDEEDPFSAVDEALAHVTLRCTQLRQLEVFCHGMSNVSLTIVASNCRNLRKLTCGSGGSISDVGLAALAQGCKQLEHLQILEITGRSYSQPGFTHEGVMAVARSCCLLKTLELVTSSVVEDPALVALGQHCPLLRKLSCPGWDRITDAAVAALVRGCPQLEVVELPYARITDASASALAQGCPNLKTLDLLQTDVTAVGVLTLAKHAKHMLTIRIGCMDGAAARALAEEYPVEVSAQIKLTVVSQDGNEIYFQIKETTPLQKLMHAYCNRQGIAPNKIRFLFDGNCINETETPQQLEMVDGDIIDVMVEFGYGS